MRYDTTTPLALIGWPRIAFPAGSAPQPPRQPPRRRIHRRERER